MKKVFSALKRSFSLSTPDQDVRFAMDRPPAPPDKRAASDLSPPPPPPRRAEGGATARMAMVEEDSRSDEEKAAASAGLSDQEYRKRIREQEEALSSLKEKRSAAELADKVEQEVRQMRENTDMREPTSETEGTPEADVINESKERTEEALDELVESVEENADAVAKTPMEAAGEIAARESEAFTGRKTGGETKQEAKIPESTPESGNVGQYRAPQEAAPQAAPEGGGMPDEDAVNEALAESIQRPAKSDRPAAPDSPKSPEESARASEDENLPVIEAELAEPDNGDEEEREGSGQKTVQWKPGTSEYETYQQHMREAREQRPAPSGDAEEGARPKGRDLESERSRLDEEIDREERARERARNAANRLAEQGAEEKLKELRAKRERLPEEIGRARRQERRENRRTDLQARLKKLEKEYWEGKADEDLTRNVQERERLMEELENIKRLEQADRERTSGRTGRKRTVRPSGRSEQARIRPSASEMAERAPRDEFEGLSTRRLEKMLKKREQEAEALRRYRNNRERYLQSKIRAMNKREDMAERYKDTFLRGRYHALMARGLAHDVETARKQFRNKDELYRESVRNRNRIILTLENRLREQMAEPERVAERVHSNLEAAQSLAQEELSALLQLEGQLTNLEEAAADPGRNAEFVDSAWRQQVEDIRSEVLDRRSRLREAEAKVFELRSRLTREQGKIDRYRAQIASYVRRSRLPEEPPFATELPAEEPATGPDEAAAAPSPPPEETGTSPEDAAAMGSLEEAEEDEEDEDEEDEDMDLEETPRFDVDEIAKASEYIRNLDAEGGPEITEEDLRDALAAYLEEQGRASDDIESATAEDLIGAIRTLYENAGKKKDDAFWEARKEEFEQGQVVDPIS